MKKQKSLGQIAIKADTVAASWDESWEELKRDPRVFGRYKRMAAVVARVVQRRGKEERK